MSAADTAATPPRGSRKRFVSTDTSENEETTLIDTPARKNTKNQQQKKNKSNQNADNDDFINTPKKNPSIATTTNATTNAITTNAITTAATTTTPVVTTAATDNPTTIQKPQCTTENTNEEILNTNKNNIVQEEETKCFIKGGATSKVNFFAQLKVQEANKAPVGTIHSTGTAKTEDNNVANSGDWECIKRGCGKINFRTNLQCTKCKAMRRISEWR